jgi:hypothetical protein
MTDVRLPGDAFDSEQQDVAGPTADLLRSLYLLPTAEELAQAGAPFAVITGPPQSVAVLEGGATAFSKWWATGLGAGAAVVWGAVRAFYDGNGPATQRVMLWSAAIVSAALVLAIAVIIYADLRGRAAGTVATLEARREIATAVVRTAKGKDPGDAAAPPVVALPDGRRVVYLNREADEGWLAVAFEAATDASGIRWLIVKGGEQAWASSTEVKFLT